MATLSYSFCMGLLHSIWQAALLWLLYSIAEKSLQQRFTPLQKKNVLFLSLAAQGALFAFTFLIYYIRPGQSVWGILNEAATGPFIQHEDLARFAPWFFTAYILVISFKLVRSACQWFLFKKQFTAGLVKPSVDLKLFTTAQQYHFGIKRKVQLWFSNTITTPLTFGFIKPVIVLPAALVNQISLQQAETLILHELAHIKANDFLLNWFLIISETLFFFNPFIQSICKKIRLEREKYCDITVTAFNYAPLLYAEALLQAQTVKQFSPGLILKNHSLPAVNKPQHLLNRIRFFVDPANQLQQQKRNVLLPLFSLLLITVFALSFWVQVQTLRSKKQSPQSAVATLQPKQSSPATEKELVTVVNTIMDNFTEERLLKITTAAAKQQPELEKKMKQLEPLLKEVEQKAVKLAETISENFVIPVALAENEASRQIVVREEQSGSVNATIKVYNVIFKNGQWLLQPQWKLAAKEITRKDSLTLTDTSDPVLNKKETEALQD
jgi:beta-lactamase regulating signal transducer with metallopeptidase domain